MPTKIYAVGVAYHIKRIYLDLDAACKWCDHQILNTTTSNWTVYQLDPGDLWTDWQVIHNKNMRAI